MSYVIQSLIGVLDAKELGRRADIINNQFLLGHFNTTAAVKGGGATITFVANSTTTTVTFGTGFLSGTSVLLLQPTTANAAAAMNTWYISGRDVPNGILTITHANNAQTDRTFGYSLNG